MIIETLVFTSWFSNKPDKIEMEIKPGGGNAKIYLLYVTPSHNWKSFHQIIQEFIKIIEKKTISNIKIDRLNENEESTLYMLYMAMLRNG